MSAHTRGPWSIVLNPVAENGAAVTSIYATDARQSYVADVYRGYVGSEGLSEEEHRDNARLIAAAPELLDALEDIIADIGAHMVISPITGKQLVILRKGREAIAKATGAA